MVSLVLSFGSITESDSSNTKSGPDTDTIAGETVTNSGESSKPSSNIDVVGLAVFKGDVLIR